MSLESNNPGNLKPLQLPKTWHGQTGIDTSGFVQFDTMEDGFRAMTLVIAHRIKGGYNTVTKLIAGINGNNAYSTTDQQPYIDFVSSSLDVDPDAALPLDHGTIRQLVESMGLFELGTAAWNEITDEEITDGITDAETSHPNIYTPLGSGYPQAAAPAAAPAPNPQGPALYPQPQPTTPTAMQPTTPTTTQAGFTWWGGGLLLLFLFSLIRSKK